jgi:hypothetical protein
MYEFLKDEFTSYEEAELESLYKIIQQFKNK